MPRGTSVSSFIINIALRLSQLERISTTDQNSAVWLGGFFQPEAYVTATRQAVAHAKGWSLEQLELGLDIEEVSAEGFKIDGELQIPLFREQS
jgi:dynein heavy chain 1